MTSKPSISVVTPLYNTSAYVSAFHARMSQTLQNITGSYEIIFVNDASPEDDRERVLALRATDPHLGLLDLPRNHGQHKAIFAGLRQTRGDLVFVLDADLEENPEWLPAYLEALHSHNASVVYGYQAARKGGLIEKCTGWLSYFVVNRLFKLPYRRNVVTATLMTREFTEALLASAEDRAVFSVACYRTGFPSAAVTVDKSHRGISSYSLPRRFAHFADYMVAATDRPLIWPMPIGFALCFCGAAFGLYALLHGGVNYYGRIITALVLFIGGLLMATLGTMGLYLASLLANTRPHSIARTYHAPASPLS